MRRESSGWLILWVFIYCDFWTIIGGMLSSLKLNTLTYIGREEEKKLNQIIGHLMDLPEASEFIHPVDWEGTSPSLRTRTQWLPSCREAPHEPDESAGQTQSQRVPDHRGNSRSHSTRLGQLQSLQPRRTILCPRWQNGKALQKNDTQLPTQHTSHSTKYFSLTPEPIGSSHSVPEPKPTPPPSTRTHTKAPPRPSNPQYSQPSLQLE